MDKDKLIKYRQAVQNLLSRYVAEDVTSEDVEVQLIGSSGIVMRIINLK
ncbi:hypothetical protein PN470_08690 [Microcystis sp. CS-574]|nr:hypothetical protein [Microcystis sp. CS-574]MDB9404366.1 hypothetical protein [Microcystis sp. CS-574]